MKRQTGWMAMATAGGLGLLGVVAGITQETNSAPPQAEVVPAQAVAGEEVLPDRMTWRELFETGGVPMYILSGMSVLGVAVTLYFLMVLREGQVAPRKLAEDLRVTLGAGRTDEAWALCRRDRSPAAAIARAALDYHRAAESEADPALLRDIIEGEGGRQAIRIQNQIQYLQDIAVIAPMIGLLGTVLGMLTAFDAVATDIAKAKPIYLAAGVSQALITTAAGLIVGIPAMMAHAYFRGRASKLVSGLENLSVELLTLLMRKRTP